MVASLSGTFINHAVIQQIYIGFLKVENSGFISKFKKLTRLISRVTIYSRVIFRFLFFIFYILPEATEVCDDRAPGDCDL